MNKDSKPVFWLYVDKDTLNQAQDLIQIIEPKAKVLILGANNLDKVDLNLGEDPEMDIALQGCPKELRPAICVNMANKMPKGMDCLSCKVLGWQDNPGLEGQLKGDSAQILKSLIDYMKKPFRPAFLDQVQVNLPLRYLLGEYGDLIKNYPLNLEIGLDCEALDSLGPNDLSRAKSLLRNRDITVHLPFKDLVPASCDPMMAKASCNRLEKAAQWGLELGAGQMVSHLGYEWRIHRDLGQFAQNFSKNLMPLAEKLERHGCSLALENTFEPGPNVLLEVLKAFKGQKNVGLCLDVGHALAFSSTSLEDWWQAVSEHLIEIHMHDNHKDDDKHLPCGWGVADWNFLDKAIDQLSPKPVLTLEPHNEPHLWASLRGLDRLFGYPKKEL